MEKVVVVVVAAASLLVPGVGVVPGVVVAVVAASLLVLVAGGWVRAQHRRCLPDKNMGIVAPSFRLLTVEAATVPSLDS
jgi:hypothetical protein